MEHMKNEVRGIVKIGFGNDAISGVQNIGEEQIWFVKSYMYISMLK